MRPSSFNALTLLISIASVLGIAHDARSEDDDFCAHTFEDYYFEAPYRDLPAAVDTLRALVIFARHTDAEDGYDCGDFAENWTDYEEVPPWADTFIEDTEDPDDFTPASPGSLTHYFWTMSGEAHLLLGQVYPEVVVPDSTIQEIDLAYGGNE